jgi:hypothetical protein
MENKPGEIDWEALNAANVPKWLHDLTSDDREVYLNAYHNLDNYVIDIGSQSWESYGPINEILKTDLQLLIVPFLIQLLDNAQLKRKDNILELLYDLANKVYLSVDKLTGAEREQAIKIYQAVQAGVPRYQNLHVESTDSYLKESASEILNLFSIIKIGK